MAAAKKDEEEKVAEKSVRVLAYTNFSYNLPEGGKGVAHPGDWIDVDESEAHRLGAPNHLAGPPLYYDQDASGTSVAVEGLAL